MKWKKIATAPRDGTRFLAKNSGGSIDIYFWKARNCYGCEGFAHIHGVSYVFTDDLQGWAALPRAR